LAYTVEVWHDDPKVPGRQIGWVMVATTKYIRPVKRIAVRTRKKNGQWGVGLILSTLPAELAVSLARLPVHYLKDPFAVLRAYVYFYDLRGGVEVVLSELHLAKDREIPRSAFSLACQTCPIRRADRSRGTIRCPLDEEQIQELST
jgi:hypothetical protein